MRRCFWAASPLLFEYVTLCSLQEVAGSPTDPFGIFGSAETEVRCGVALGKPASTGLDWPSTPFNAVPCCVFVCCTLASPYPCSVIWVGPFVRYGDLPHWKVSLVAGLAGTAPRRFRTKCRFLLTPVHQRSLGYCTRSLPALSRELSCRDKLTGCSELTPLPPSSNLFANGVLLQSCFPVESCKGTDEPRTGLGAGIFALDGFNPFPTWKAVLVHTFRPFSSPSREFKRKESLQMLLAYFFGTGDLRGIRVSAIMVG